MEFREYDVAALFSASHWKTPLDVYNEKLGISKVIKLESESNRFMRDYGKSNKSLALAAFQYYFKTVLTEVNKVLSNLKYPFIQAFIDAIAYLPDNKKAIVLSKTETTFKKNVWGDENEPTIPDAYRYEAIHSMIAADADVCFLIAIYGNMPSDIIIRRIDRDISNEQFIIEIEKSFMENNILVGVPPNISEIPDTRKDKSYRYGSWSKVSAKDIPAPEKLYKQYLFLKSRLDEIEEEKKQKDLELLEIKADFIEILGQHCQGKFIDSQGNRYTATYNPTKKSEKKIDAQKLQYFKLLCPKVYNENVTISEGTKTLQIKDFHSKT